MVRFIPVETLLATRNEVLREGKLTHDECRYPSDNLPDTFHLGYYIDNELACIGSFHLQTFNGYNGQGYQLRGMATIEKYRGRNFGSQLLNYATAYLSDKKVNYLWCNAREKALKFYLNFGFEIISNEFEIAGIGPHYVLYIKIK